MHQVNSDIRSRLLSARLPAMPQILLKLIELCQDEDAGIGDLADLIAKDPGIASKVLAIANSSAYHRNGRALGLEPALTALGTDMIRTLVINESVFQVFNNLTPSNATDLRAFWKHSLSVAALAKEIAGKTGGIAPEEAYLAGLLHDVGRLALLTATEKEFAFLFFARDDDTLLNIEHSLLNLTHTEAGAILADRWHLDSFLSDSLLYHHQAIAGSENAHPLVRNLICAHQISLRADDDPALLAAAVACGLAATDIAPLRAQSQAKLNQYAEALGIDLTGADELLVPTDGWEIAGRLASLDENNGDLDAPEAAVEPPLPPQEAVRRALVEEVRNVVLTSELRQSLAPLPGQEAASCEAIARSSRILFELDDVAIFRKTATGDALVGVPVGEHSQRLSTFSIRLDGHSRLSQATRSHEVLFIERDPAHSDLAEIQLMRLFGSDGLISLPLRHGTDYIGMVIGGVGAWQLPALKKRERFLRSFGSQAASALQAAAEASAASAERPEPTGVPRKIVHESNNALSIIKNYLSILDVKLEKQQIASPEIAILHDEVDRVGRIINTMGAEATVTDADQALGHIVQLFTDTAPAASTTRVVAELQESACEIVCSPESLKQILINLVKNAIEAVPENGEIRLTNHGLVNRDGQLYVELCVQDNGPGIPPPILASLFSPVSSTKGGLHQGLGLNIVHDLVKQSQGLISCRSNPKGTAFTLLFPARPIAAGLSPRDIAK